jgi:hypothetical protein
VPKQQIPPSLELVRGGVVLGSIDVKKGEADFPWYSGLFHPSGEFQSVRKLFERELQLLQSNTSDDSAQWDEWEAVHEELHGPGLQLVAPDEGYDAGEVIIHIDGSEAWWRSGKGLGEQSDN